MPHFKWHGVDLSGTAHSGSLFTSSVHELEQILLRRNLALIKARKVRILLQRPITLTHTTMLFKELSRLLSAGIRLPDGLRMIAQGIRNPTLQEITQNLADQVSSGESFSYALQSHSSIFDEFMIQMAHTGQESGRLDEALDRLSSCLEEMKIHRAQFRMLALVPFMTLSFFIVVASILFTTVVPTFASMFAESRTQLPTATKYILAIGGWFEQQNLTILILAIILCCILVLWFRRTKWGKHLFDTLLLRIPLYGFFVRRNALVRFLHSFSVLVATGVPIIEAVPLAGKSLNNVVFVSYIASVEEEIRTGNSLSQSMALSSGNFFEQDIIFMTHIGEESGNLAGMMAQAVSLYHKRNSDMLASMRALFQPAVIIVLGLLTGLLVSAIYIPLFDMSDLMATY